MSDLFSALDATWPAVGTALAGEWRVRQGAGGGKRVSSATAEAETAVATIHEAEAQHAAFGQPPLFCIRDGQDKIDRALADRGYELVDPVVLYAARAADIGAEAPDRLSTFPLWPPLAIARDIWAAGGIGVQRQAVMERVTGPRTSILGRADDRAAGAVFVAVHGTTAMVHALHVEEPARRLGLGRNLMRAAARWAAAEGAETLALAVTRANGPANALYAAMGMTVVARYHYRSK